MEKIEETVFKDKEKGYWDFKNVYSIGIHKIVNYPATMVPNMQHEIIKTLKDYDNTITSLLDPFHGSGVTLVESKSLGIIPSGIDINPLAHLISKVKLQGVNKKALNASLKKVIEKVKDQNLKFEKHYFNNINKWFRQDIITDLSKLKFIIESEKVVNIRRYYWVCLINIIKKYSNTRNTTFKLHVKLEDDILNLENNIFDDFIKAISTNHQHLPNYSRSNKYDLRLGDSKEILKSYKEESFDLVCTSPPYGDNATTVTYGQYSMLPIYWIKFKDMGIGATKQELIETYSSIDTLSLGGRKKKDDSFESLLLENFLIDINQSKRKKIKSFFIDYTECLDELIRVLRVNKYIVITLGNRRVDNQQVPLVEFTKEYLRANDCNIISDIEREIQSKRMPKKVSRVGSVSVTSMSREHVLIAKKMR